MQAIGYILQCDHGIMLQRKARITTQEAAITM